MDPMDPSRTSSKISIGKRETYIYIIYEYIEFIDSMGNKVHLSYILLFIADEIPPRLPSPEIWWWGKDCPLGKPYFQVRTVSFREG